MSQAPALRNDAIAPNAKWLLWAGFMAILAAGVGFSIRTGIMDNWTREYSFTQTEIGAISSMGFTGFCFGIIIGGVIADKIGYGKLVIAAFLFHVLSAVVTFTAVAHVTTGTVESATSTSVILTPAEDAPDEDYTGLSIQFVSADGERQSKIITAYDRETHEATLDTELEDVPASTSKYVVAVRQVQAYYALYWGMFLFALANGTLEAVANPLIATLFPHNRAHYLNILHASWPAGLILGSLISWVLDDEYEWNWKYQLAFYLIPTAIYGFMFFGQKMPKSEASKSGLSVGQMFADVGVLGGLIISCLLAMFFAQSLGLTNAGYSIGILILVVILLMTHTHGSRGDTLIPMGAFLLFVLFITHGLVGAVELGTDNWLPNINGNILTSQQGKMLFVWASFVMFSLRFCANFIEKKIGLSPVGILLTCSVLACFGLVLVSNATTFVTAMLAMTVYGVGKTFFWPTMLAVGSDRYPKTGAIAISIMGGIGMMSAGLIGAAGLGYAKDRFASQSLEEADPDLYAQYTSEGRTGSFLFFQEVKALNPADVSAVQTRVADARKILEDGGVDELDESSLAAMNDLERATAEQAYKSKVALQDELVEAGVLKLGESGNPEDALKILTPEQVTVHESAIQGDRMTLRADAFIPGTMAVIYLLMLLYFKSIGGYKVVHINGGKDGPPEEGIAHGSFEG